MSIIGKIAKEIGEEVAEGLTKKAAPKVMPAVKKPLEWGFKGRKPTDIEDLDYTNLTLTPRGLPGTGKRHPDIQNIFDRNRKKLKKGAEKNKYIKEFLEDPDYVNIEDQYWPSDLIEMNRAFRGLEIFDVPRELTGKMIGNKLGVDYRKRLWRQQDEAKKLADWQKGWLRYHKELDDTQKETFDILSNEWNGTVNDLVDAAKSL